MRGLRCKLVCRLDNRSCVIARNDIHKTGSCVLLLRVWLRSRLCEHTKYKMDDVTARTGARVTYVITTVYVRGVSEVR